MQKKQETRAAKAQKYAEDDVCTWGGIGESKPRGRESSHEARSLLTPSS